MNKIKTALMGAAALAALAFAVPAQADTLLQKLHAVSNQNVTLDEQWNVGVQWADSDYGAITEVAKQTNAGVIASNAAKIDLADCDCFNDVTVDMNLNNTQTLAMNNQINGALQVGLTGAEISLDLSQINVGGAISGASDILSSP